MQWTAGGTVVTFSVSFRCYGEDIGVDLLDGVDVLLGLICSNKITCH